MQTDNHCLLWPVLSQELQMHTALHKMLQVGNEPKPNTLSQILHSTVLLFQEIMNYVSAENLWTFSHISWVNSEHLEWPPRSPVRNCTQRKHHINSDAKRQHYNWYYKAAQSFVVDCRNNPSTLWTTDSHTQTPVLFQFWK